MTRPFAALLVLACTSCGGHQISSWSPSGSLEWEEPRDDESADAGADDATAASDVGSATADAGAAEASDAGPATEAGAPLTAMERAEAFFTAGDMTPAIEAYGVVFATGTRYEQAYALYKLAWCASNIALLEQAIERLVQLLGLLDPPRDTQERRLRRQAVGDLGLFESGRADSTPQEALDRLAGILSGEELQQALEVLADEYRATGRLEAEALVRQRLAH
jgi:hypothetical protein